MYYFRPEDVYFMDELQRRIQIARGAIPADLVLLNAKLVNVCGGAG